MRKYVKTPTIFQMEMTECGAASLCMVLASYGCCIPLEQMRVDTGVSRDGCSMKGIKAAAQKYGLEAHAYRRGTERLQELDMPCIIHWHGNHFVVLEGFRGRHAFINDPAVGRRRLTLRELDEGFSGVVMTLRKTERFRENRRGHTERDFATRRLKGHCGALLLLLVTGLALLLPALLLPMLLWAMIDSAWSGSPPGHLAGLLALMGGGILLWVALSCCRLSVRDRLCARMTLYSGKSLLERLFRLPVSFFEQRYTGDLVSRALNNADVSRFLAGDWVEMAVHVVSCCALLAALMRCSPLLAGIGLLKAGAGALLALPGAGAVKDASMRMMMSRGELSGAISAGLSAAASIKAAGLEAEYSSRIIGSHERYAALEQRVLLRRQTLRALTAAVHQLFNVLLLFAGGLLMIQGSMTPGTLAACCLLLASLSASADQLTGFFLRLQKVRPGISRIMDIENHAPGAPRGGQAALRTSGGRLCGNIELKNVCIGYSPLHPPVIEGLSFAVDSGQTVALVGASGCGKSTVVRMLGGLYRPWSGELLFDGIPCEQIPRPAFCNSVATVSQDIHLFSGTIRDNLTLWDPTVLQADLDRAVRDACIDDLIARLPGGYDFRLDEAARNLSGGERQRLEIARALARKPGILILDEATSALDPLVEKRIMDNIRRRGCTCILIAHRLSAIRHCSRIIVMEHGRIAESGTHAQLLRDNGLYAALMRAEHGGHAAREEASGAC